MNRKCEAYEKLGKQLITELFPQLKDVRIAWLESDKAKKAKGKIIFAECAKVPEKLEWCCPYDFTITVYEPNARHMTEEQLRILLEHEIMHIGKDKTIVPHDAEDFRGIIEKYGIDWAR